MRTSCGHSLVVGFMVATSSFLQGAPARACGGELPISCIDTEDAALNLLMRAVVAVKRDKPQALSWFSEQSHDFRTVDLYVFCIGPGNLIDAHPDPKLRGRAAAELVDIDGFRFAAAMIERASADAVARITYKWPRLGETRPILKHSFYTRVDDEICGVGSYDE